MGLHSFVSAGGNQEFYGESLPLNMERVKFYNWSLSKLLALFRVLVYEDSVSKYKAFDMSVDYSSAKKEFDWDFGWRNQACS